MMGKCESCEFYPPSSFDGKPCGYCDTSNPYMNCYRRREYNDGNNTCANTNVWDKEEVWEAIHKLSDVRAGFSVFAKEERSVYHACSLAIKALKEVIGE